MANNTSYAVQCYIFTSAHNRRRHRQTKLNGGIERGKFFCRKANSIRRYIFGNGLIFTHTGG